MSDAPGQPEREAGPGRVPVRWLERQRRTAALQLEALSPRGARHRTGRAVALRRRVRVLDAEIASRSSAR
jgi:hypothetical protein